MEQYDLTTGVYYEREALHPALLANAEMRGLSSVVASVGRAPSQVERTAAFRIVRGGS